MFKKTLDTLKKNPIIIVMYFFMLAVTAVSFIFVSPHYRKVIDISEKINANTDNPNVVITQYMSDILKSSLILLIFCLFILGFTIVYFSGFGNILSQAVCDGKTSLKSFFQGIKKYFVKVLLAFLLLIAFSFGFGFIMTVVSIFTSAGSIVSNTVDQQAIYNSQRMTLGISYIFMILAYPFILLWLPSIFMDNSDGVIACLKKGCKAGVKRYKVLVLITAFFMMPTIVVQAFTYSADTNIFSPVYIGLYIYQAIMVPVFLTFIFVLYNETKKTNVYNITNVK